MPNNLSLYHLKNAVVPIVLFLGYGSALAQQKTLTDPLGIVFIQVTKGAFTAGKFYPPYPLHATEPSKDNAAANGYRDDHYALAARQAKQDASAGFSATIQSDFYIGKFELTQEQWQRVMGNNPSVFKGDKVDDEASLHPVENVTWQDVQVFLKKINTMNSGYTYRLPTEFEWEYAARAGADDDIEWREILETAQIGKRTTQAVGQKKPNAWGLYDMLGNVWEWVQDFYNEKIFADPTPPRSGKEHVLKGASFVGDVKNATYMTHAAGPGNKWDIGFRLVVEVSKP